MAFEWLLSVLDGANGFWVVWSEFQRSLLCSVFGFLAFKGLAKGGEAARRGSVTKWAKLRFGVSASDAS